MVPEPDSDGKAPNVNRRRLLQGVAASGLVATAGCLGGGDDDEADVENATNDTETVADTDAADTDEEGDVVEVDIPEGGRIDFALARGSISSYDQANSTEADDATIFGTVYDGLRVTDEAGVNKNWMASSFEVTDTQNVSEPGDYTDYMEEYEIQEVSEGTAIYDLDFGNLVLIDDPDDAEAVANGDLSAGDSAQILTRNEAGAAVDDGVYGTKIEVELHEGITFSNGEELTAEHIVRSFDRHVGGDLEGQQFDSFLHARTTGEYSVELYSREADAIADTSIIPFTIFPSDHWEIPPGELDPRADGPVPVGTGPYEVESFEEGSELVLTRTDNYWVEDVGLENKEWWDGPEGFPGGPVIDEINIRFQPSPGQRVAALQDGSVDLAYDLTPADYTAFQQDDEFEEFRVTAAEGTGYVFMQIPTNSGPLSNQEVREAIQRMIPRQEIVDTVEEGWSVPARVPFPRPAANVGTAGDFEDLFEEDWAYPLETQPDQAESLVSDAGVDTPIDIRLDTNADDQVRQSKVELIVAELSGTDAFSAELNTPADLSTWFVQDLAGGGAGETYSEDVATATLGLAGGFDPDGYARVLNHPDNYGICCNFFHPPGTFEDLNAMVDEARFGAEVAADPAARTEIYDQIWPEYAQQIPATFLNFSLDRVVARPKITGYNAYPDRRSFLTYGLYAPYAGTEEPLITFIPEEDRE